MLSLQEIISLQNKDTNTAEKGNRFDWNVFKRLFEFIGNYKKHFYVLCLSIFTVSIISPFIALLTVKAINGPIKAKDLSGLQDIILMMLGVLLVQSILQFTNTYLSSWLGQHIIKDLRVKLYKHLSSFKVSYYDKTPIGRLVTRNVSDIETIADVFSQGIAAMLADILMLLFIMAYMFYLNVRLTFVSLATIPFLLYATYLFKEKIKHSFDSVRTAVSNLNTYVNEHITGMLIVQVFNKEQRVLDEFKNINTEHKKAQLSTVKYYSIYFPVAELIAAVGIGFLVWFAGRDSLLGKLDEPGDIVGFIMLIGMFFRPLRLIADRFNQLQLGIVSTSRIVKLLDEDHSVQNSSKDKLTHPKGDVEFQQVHFEYKEGITIINDVSFKIHAGEMVAIVGATGSGKTTLVNLLNRFYDLSSGDIKLDGHSINSLDVTSLRKTIGIVQQDVFLFTNSVYENIVLGDYSITKDDVWKTIDLVGGTEFIRKIPSGLDYKIQERGGNLSVGQRQLLSFVRAMVHNPKILVLDEATSSVDSKTEKLIQSAIEKMMSNRTSLVVAHRLSTIEKADKIIVLNKGEVVESGTHKELLLEKGYYNNLYEMQFKHHKND